MQGKDIETKKWTFARDGVEEEVKPEEWAWEVGYRDGGFLSQFGDDGKFHQMREIEQDRVACFIMYKMDDHAVRRDVFIRPGMRVFHFYHRHVFQFGDGEETRATTYCFGWKDPMSGAAGYHYILPNGSMAFSCEPLPIIGTLAQISVQNRMNV